MGLRGRTNFQDKQCFFVTTTCYDFQRLIATTEAKLIVSDSLNFVGNKYKADILAYVIMPNHIHLIVYFREESALSGYMGDFKKFTSVQLRKLKEETGDVDGIRFKRRKQQFKVWEDRFDDLWLERFDILLVKLNYIHNNPLQSHWKLAARPEEYPYSSARFYEDGTQPAVAVTDYRMYFTSGV